MLVWQQSSRLSALVGLATPKRDFHRAAEIADLFPLLVVLSTRALGVFGSRQATAGGTIAARFRLLLATDLVTIYFEAELIRGIAQSQL
jgi:hypothetical protein